MRTTFVVVGSAALALAGHRVAEACSPPLCWPGFLVPGDGSQVPASVPALYWQTMAGSGGTDPQQVVLTRADAPGVPLPFSVQAYDVGARVDYLVIPDAPLAAGTSYVLSDQNQCVPTATTGPEVTFTTGPAAALPSGTQLGTLTAGALRRDTLWVGTSSGSCTAQIDAGAVDVALAPAGEVAAWLPVLHFETRVDGQPWRPVSAIITPIAPGASWQGRGADTLFTTCASEDPGAIAGLAPGAHQVIMRATLPGSSVALETPPITVEVSCDAVGDQASDGGDGGCGGCTADRRGAPGALFAILVGLALAVRRRARPS